MSNGGRAIGLTLVLVLLSIGIWANLTSSRFPETRGMWVTHAMRGISGY
jgi:hypothetical protein